MNLNKAILVILSGFSPHLIHFQKSVTFVLFFQDRYGLLRPTKLPEKTLTLKTYRLPPYAHTSHTKPFSAKIIISLLSMRAGEDVTTDGGFPKWHPAAF